MTKSYAGLYRNGIEVKIKNLTITVSVYGDSVDKIVQGNTSNIVFLKSTDDSLLDTLQKMSGVTHKVFINSKTVTRNADTVFQSIGGLDGKVPYTMSTQEVPVISYNDMAFISPRNSIVFRAGDSPIWNRNETILPMSWKLHSNTIKQPGKEYTFQTIPTLSSAKEFDVRKNQPNFGEMFEKRVAQALKADEAKQIFMSVHDYTSDYDIAQLDPDLYASSIMELINLMLHINNSDDTEDMNDYLNEQESMYDKAEPDKEVIDAISKEAEKERIRNTKCFAGGYLSVNDIITHYGINTGLARDIIDVFVEIKGDFTNDKDNFSFKNGSLYSADGSKPYITKAISSSGKSAADVAKDFNAASKSKDTRVYSDYDINEADLARLGAWEVHREFYEFLASQPDWKGFAKGRFEEQMSARLRDRMS